MWSQQTIKENLDKNQLPCGRCHKWKDSKTEFGKYANGKMHKVCKDCNKNWKEAYAEKSSANKNVSELRKKDDDCCIM